MAGKKQDSKKQIGLVVTPEEYERLKQQTGQKGSSRQLYPKQMVALTRTEDIIGVGGGKFGGKTHGGIYWMISGNKHAKECAYRTWVLDANREWVQGACDCPFPDYDTDGNRIAVNHSYVHHPKFLGVVIRENVVDLRDWVREARAVFEPLGGDWREGDKEFHWPGGATVFCGHYQDEDSFTKYAGLNITRFLVEEATHIPNVKRRIQMLRSCNRSAYPEMRAQMMLTFNPGGVSHGDILDMFVEPKDENGEIIPPETTITEEYDADEIFARLGVPKPPEIGEKITSTRVFVFSKLSDNPAALTNEKYIAALMDMPEEEREAYLFGNWRVLAGEYFRQFRGNGPYKNEPLEANHVIPFNIARNRIQPWWWRTMACDWGFGHECATGWGCHDQDRDQFWITDEMVVSQTEPDVVGEEIARRTKPILTGLESPMIVMGLSHDAYGLRQDDRSIAELMAKGIARILGPNMVHLPDLMVDKLKDQMEQQGQSTATAEADKIFENIRSQQKMGITIRRMRDSRIVGWQLVRSLMRWKSSLPEIRDIFDPNMASNIAYERGLEAYGAYVKLFQQKQEVLPKLQIVGPPAACPTCGGGGKFRDKPEARVQCEQCGAAWLPWQLKIAQGTGLGCSRLITAIPKAVRDPQNPEDVTRKHVEGASDLWDMCFVAGTMVETDHGGVPIQEISAGDLVWTRFGLCRVSASAMTSPEAKVRQIEMSGGTKLEGTDSHPVFVDGKGFTPLKDVNYGDTLWVWQDSRDPTLNASCITDIDIGGIRSARIGRRESTTNAQTRAPKVRSIARCGSLISDLFRSIATFTIRTQTRTITPRITLNVSAIKNTQGSITLAGQCRPAPPKRSVKRALNGTIMADAELFQNSQSGSMRSFLRCLWNAVSAIPFLKQTFSMPRVALDSALQGASPATAWPIASITRLGAVNCVGRSGLSGSNRVPDAARRRVVKNCAIGKAAVFNVTVEGHPEYFANGILVHNCRYLALTFRGQSMPEPFEALRRRKITEAREAHPNYDTGDLVHVNRRIENAWKSRNAEQQKPIHVLRSGRAMRARVKGLISGPQ